jgi:hypothetical protein
VSNPVVTFDYNGWLLQYPEFAYVTAPQATGYFNQATLLVDNTPSSPVQDQAQLATLLNMATAHIAALFAPAAGQGPRGIVGRINSASEGSVSVQAAYTEPKTDSQAYWNQTPYGAQYWVATLQYRTASYLPAPCAPNQFPAFPAQWFLRR